jgi:hypothetical protein
MLTKDQYLLTLVMEECDEVSQRASKAIRFGLDERQPGNPYSNAERLVGEIIDLYESVDELLEGGYIKLPADLEVHRAARREKIQRYLKRAQAEGRVEA